MKTIDTTGDMNDGWMRKELPYEGMFRVIEDIPKKHLVDSVNIDGELYTVFSVTKNRYVAKFLASNKFKALYNKDVGLWYVIALEPEKETLDNTSNDYKKKVIESLIHKLEGI